MKLLRHLFWLMLLLGGLAMLGIAALAFVVFAPLSTVGEMEFEQALAIPPLAKSHVTDGGVRVFDLTAQQGMTELLPGKPTDAWGCNGTYLGPRCEQHVGKRSA